MARRTIATAFDIVSATTTNVVFANTSTDVIQIWRVVLFCSGADTVTWEDSTGATLYPSFAFAANSGMILGESEDPWMTAPNGRHIRIVTSAAQRCAGRLFYTRE